MGSDVGFEVRGKHVLHKNVILLFAFYWFAKKHIIFSQSNSIILLHLFVSGSCNRIRLSQWRNPSESI